LVLVGDWSKMKRRAKQLQDVFGAMFNCYEKNAWSALALAI
jgi:hypothetical protein